MGLFLKNHYEDKLDSLLANIHMNMSNNYKDAAQQDLVVYERQLNEYIADGKHKQRTINRHNKELNDLKETLKGYTHKDQKPNW